MNKPTGPNKWKVRRTKARTVRMMKRFYVRFVRLRGTPHQISLGLALGFLVGMTPFLGAHTVIAIFLASLFKWSKITATIGVMITNPLTAPLIYPVTYKLGNSVTGLSDPSQWSKIFEPGGVIALMKSSPVIIVDLSVGGMIVGIPLAVITYYVTLNAVTRARKRIERRRARRATARRAKKKRLLAKRSTSAAVRGRSKWSGANSVLPSGIDPINEPVQEQEDRENIGDGDRSKRKNRPKQLVADFDSKDRSQRRGNGSQSPP